MPITLRRSLWLVHLEFFSALHLSHLSEILFSNLFLSSFSECLNIGHQVFFALLKQSKWSHLAERKWFGPLMPMLRNVSYSHAWNIIIQFLFNWFDFSISKNISEIISSKIYYIYFDIWIISAMFLMQWLWDCEIYIKMYFFK